MANIANDLGNLGNKKAIKFYCKYCDYNAGHLSKWERHIKTKKHNANEMLSKANKKSYKGQLEVEEKSEDIECKFKCKCGKQYLHASSYCRHKKTCSSLKEIDKINTENQIIDTSANNIKMMTEMFPKMFDLISKQHDDTMEMFNKIVAKEPSNSQSGTKNMQGISGSHNTQNNQEVNINLYLNENCSDAMSIQGFAKQLSISLEDLMKNGKPAIKEGVSNVFIENLRPLALEDRPLHYVEAEKKSWHIKDEKEGWKSGSQESAITETRNQIQIELQKIWDRTYPDWQNNSRQVDDFQMMCSVLYDDPTPRDIAMALNRISTKCKVSFDELQKIAKK